MSKLIEFRDVVKKFNGVPVLNGVTFSVEKGEVLCIVVPGTSRMFGLLKGRDAMGIPFSKIKKLGEDVILVELP